MSSVFQRIRSGPIIFVQSSRPALRRNNCDNSKTGLLYGDGFAGAAVVPNLVHTSLTSRLTLVRNTS